MISIKRRKFIAQLVLKNPLLCFIPFLNRCSEKDVSNYGAATWNIHEGQKTWRSATFCRFCTTACIFSFLSYKTIYQLLLACMIWRVLCKHIFFLALLVSWPYQLNSIVFIRPFQCVCHCFRLPHESLRPRMLTPGVKHDICHAFLLVGGIFWGSAFIVYHRTHFTFSFLFFLPRFLHTWFSVKGWIKSED